MADNPEHVPSPKAEEPQAPPTRGRSLLPRPSARTAPPKPSPSSKPSPKMVPKGLPSPRHASPSPRRASPSPDRAREHYRRLKAAADHEDGVETAVLPEKESRRQKPTFLPPESKFPKCTLQHFHQRADHLRICAAKWTSSFPLAMRMLWASIHGQNFSISADQVSCKLAGHKMSSGHSVRRCACMITREVRVFLRERQGRDTAERRAERRGTGKV